MIIDIDQVLYVQYCEYKKEYEIAFKNHERVISISKAMYKELVKQIKELECVGCSLLCL